MNIKNKKLDEIDKMLEFCSNVIHRIQTENNMWDFKIKVAYGAGTTGEHKHRTVLAEINVDLEYLKATVKLSPAFLEKYRKKKYEDLTEILCHELSHLYTSELEEVAMDRFGTPDAIKIASERMTERFGRKMYELMNVREELKNIKQNATSKSTTRNIKHRR